MNFNLSMFYKLVDTLHITLLSCFQTIHSSNLSYIRRFQVLSIQQDIQHKTHLMLHIKSKEKCIQFHFHEHID